MAIVGGTGSDDALSVGRRLKVLRTRRGMTREVLGGLVGRSASWVKAVETGRLAAPKLSMLLRLAEALRVRDLAELTGGQSIPVVLFSGPGHDRLTAVRAAVNRLPVSAADQPAPSVADLRGRVTWAWRARHAAPNHREVLGGLLPGLLDDAQRTARAEADGPQRRAALAVLAEVYALTQFFVSYQPAQDLVWRVAERGVSTALDSDDLHAVGVAAWLMTQAHREAGDWDAADVVASQATALLRDSLSSDDATDDVAALWGALQFESGYTAARRGEIGNAWRYWDAADAVARRLPDDYFHPVTSFSQTVMHAHAVTVAVELRQSGEGVRQAERWRAAVIPSHPRQARHWIEQARAYQIDRKYDEALRLLDHAYDSAPETIRYNGHARRIILEELDARDGRRREQASELARKVGLLGV